MSSVQLYKELDISDIVFVSGLARSGKVLASALISSFDNVDKVSANFSLEQTPCLTFLNKIPYDTSTFILKSGLNLMVYDNSIGRNANFRPKDYTSISNYKDPIDYMKRLTKDEGDKALLSIRSENLLTLMLVHNGLWHANVWFDSVPHLKFIHVARNPVEIVYSWMLKKYDGEFSIKNNSRDTLPTFLYKDQILPYYVYGWEDTYLRLNKIDKIIHMVDKIREHHKVTYESLTEDRKKRILFIKHSDMLKNTSQVLSEVSNFISRAPSIHTERVCFEQNCPRSDSLPTPFQTSNKTFEEKLTEIKSSASYESFKILERMLNEFEASTQAI